MTTAASKLYRERHPERHRLQRHVGMLKRRGASPGMIRKYERLLAESKLSVCPICQEDYRTCSARGDCR